LDQCLSQVIRTRSDCVVDHEHAIRLGRESGVASSVTSGDTKNIAVVGSGISGLSAAWLLAHRHRVTLYESSPRLGGHTSTIQVGQDRVDTGFIVFNEQTYPNLVALFGHLGVETRASEMSFSVSLDHGKLEYAGTDLAGLFAQKTNLLRPRFWAMLKDLARFYREAPGADASGLSLGEFLNRHRYGAAFRDDHLLPMAAAIWSAPANTLLNHPAESFIRFCDNHGLLKFTDRPVWRTVMGGSASYIPPLIAPFRENIRLNCGVRQIWREHDHVVVEDRWGGSDDYDHVVIAAHADQALAMLGDPGIDEVLMLRAFRYSKNQVSLHRDAALMPKRRQAWTSWNYLGKRPKQGAERELSVTYWMNRLQGLPEERPYFVTLNAPEAPPDPIRSEEMEHPIFDLNAIAAQKSLWRMQGSRRTWFCGAYCGAGFHEDGLQAGLLVAEKLGGVQRPWHVRDQAARLPAEVALMGVA